MRIKAVIQYDGSRFDGFQCQKHTKNTITYKLYQALKKIGIESRVIGSGRTDKGVHATAQVVHFDVPSYWEDLLRLQTYLNRHLAPFIQIRSLQKVPDTFHARYSAKKRAYRYIVSKKELSVFEAAYKTYAPLNIQLTRKALELFEGEHDFALFMKTGSDTKSTIRTIYTARVYEHKSDYILYFVANGFLRSQIRMMVDFLFKLSQDRLSLWQLQMQVATKERFSTSLAPPNGLYLCRVIY